MAVKVKLKLKQLQWELLAKLLRETTAICPVEDWSLETYIIADLYIKKMAFWTIYPYTRKGVKVSLTMVQALAINQFFGATSKEYNFLLRIYIEPQLILDVTKLKENRCAS